MTIEYLETHRGIGLLDEVTTVRIATRPKGAAKPHGRVWMPAMRAAMSKRLKQVIAKKRKAAEARSKAANEAASARKPKRAKATA